MSKDTLVTINRKNTPKGDKRNPITRTLEQAEKKIFSNQNLRTGDLVEVVGYEAKDGKLVKKAGKNDK